MKQRRLQANVNADTLLELRERLNRKGLTSPMLDLRLRYNEQTQIRDQYLSHVYEPGATVQPVRLYPQFLPTQASGRWSVTRPPLVNFPYDIRDVVWPDPGQVWVAWDLDAIEAKIVAAFSHDKDDLEAFTNRYDIHTITACRMTGMSLPPDLRDPHQSPECADWRARLKWEGKDDKRRILAKVRYALLYGKDHTAIHGSKYERDFVKMGFSRDKILDAAKAFLRSKPQLTSWKRRTWERIARTGEARTIFGRRRRMFGDKWSKAKEGLNHEVQGSVTDMVNISLIEISELPYHPVLVYPSHDAAKMTIKAELVEGELRAQTIAEFKRAVEKEHMIDGEKITSTATWHIYHADGTVEDEDSTTGKWKVHK
jgi:DNA polymerase I-like protein with 3'-5' exonuclease and polymerase domains